MKATNHFNISHAIDELKHFLPAQAPLKDFVHHNTLHAFQDKPFFEALHEATTVFGYKVTLDLTAYRNLFIQNRINKDILYHILENKFGLDHVNYWADNLIKKEYQSKYEAQVGKLRKLWKNVYHIDLDTMVHPLLFRVLCSYLDQGIAIHHFPIWHKSFINAMIELEKKSFTSFFKTDKARKYLFDHTSIEQLLQLIVGDERYFETYLFGQQFAHQGWSGIVAAIEHHPSSLLDTKKITLEDFIKYELLLELDALYYKFGEDWKPLSHYITDEPVNIFEAKETDELFQVLTLWQEAYEWSYYDEVLAAIRAHHYFPKDPNHKTFQALFCIDDRECSLRRYIELEDAHCETFGTPGFFNVPFYFKPENGKFSSKLCPAPMNPKFLVKEVGTKAKKHEKDYTITKKSHTLLTGWFYAQVIGLWSGIKLFLDIIKPSAKPAIASSLRYMDSFASLTIEFDKDQPTEDGLQIGFTLPEMIDVVEGQLKSIGLTENFAPLIYMIGHGSSSVNNPHYAAYDCGACSGRPGSVNARVFAYMANHVEVRKALRERGIDLPFGTQFVSGLHDTARDEIIFYDENELLSDNKVLHAQNVKHINKALMLNAKERSRKFDAIDTADKLESVYHKVKLRTVSLFEPRPELNHANNALCIVARRSLTEDIFLDRRSFMNSYDYNKDPEGKYLANILNAATPVCAGINLEYYFSKVDNLKLGAGTKLPHNVMGLVGVANGIDGDLRPGLPSQMIEMHDPLRLLMIVEHHPEIVLNVIKANKNTYEWYDKEWVKLVVVDPDEGKYFAFKNGAFEPYTIQTPQIQTMKNIQEIFEKSADTLPVYLIK